ncbi:hypothetical protein BDK92_1920 [Micromonospora pisi]|uniref:Uncharacterized protein n=1 Tax=Micromonospora pisi TaxID=589240 RepID=A0A495JHV8_9ACTN|nr:hypothetical protein [Micromonospora pisi]RKR87629.1 hypothetical protein BDK92_1920 [Micromonospora pisi]
MSESDVNQSDEQPPLAETEAAEAGTEVVPATGAGLPPTAQTFFAVVNANGTLARGFGVVSSTRLATGQYQVAFTHDVRGSAYVGTLGLSGSVGASPSGEIAVVGRAGLINGVFVQTFASTGTASDRGFHLAIHS